MPFPDKSAAPTARQGRRAVMLCVTAAIAFLGFGTVSGLPGNAEEPAPAAKSANSKHFDERIRPFLNRHCLECHGAVKPKGKFRVDELAADFDKISSRERWQAVLKKIEAGEMPPKENARPAKQEVQILADWVNGNVKAAVARSAAEGRVVMRRLNRLEYENTIRDLLGIEIDLKESLPQDGMADGFDNVGAALHISSFLMEKYLEAADKSLTLAIANRPKPPSVKKRYSLKDQHQVKVTTESVFRTIDDTVVMFCSSAWQEVRLYQFYPSNRGQYRFRISVSGYQSADKPITFRVGAGAGLGRLAGKNGLVGYFDAPANKPTVIEFVATIEPQQTIAILPYGLPGSNTVSKIGADKYEGPGLAVQWIEVEGPLNDTWPPVGHREIFGDLKQGLAPSYNFRDRVEVISKNPEADAEAILHRFARRAFRRAVTDDDIKPFLKLVNARLADKHSFEQSMRVGIMGVMLSPEFLFLQEKPGKLDDFALASRLSYFLWSTTPDDELLTLAEQKKLSQPEILRQQVERLLKHPKAATFTENFVGQWLGLRDIDATEPSHVLYPEFDHMLKVSMIRETELFFDEVLKNDLSLTNFVASDFSMLNGRLAKHYGIPDVNGWEFRKVMLPKESHRGGVLTMAAVLKVTANGTYTSPVNRGVWILDRILGTPPPPPPEAVSAIVPDTRGAITIRDQLAKHRQNASCASCHVKIDPPGFALESFDVIGGWRENYRTTGNGGVVMVEGRRMPYHKGKPVDPADVLPDGQKFQNIDEFKQLLLKDKDQLARALAEKIVVYATGGAASTVDKEEIETIVKKVREKNYGLRSLVHEVVESKLFLNK